MEEKWRGVEKEDEQGKVPGDGIEKGIGKIETDGVESLLMLDRYSIPLPLTAPYPEIHFMRDGNTMQGILRPSTDGYLRFSILLKIAHTTTIWPIPMTFRVSLYRGGLCGDTLLESYTLGDLCYNDGSEFCSVNIPEAVLEQCKDKVELKVENI